MELVSKLNWMDYNASLTHFIKLTVANLECLQFNMPNYYIKFPIQWTLDQKTNVLFHSLNIFIFQQSFYFDFSKWKRVFGNLLLVFTFWFRMCDCSCQQLWMPVLPPPHGRSGDSKQNSGEICRIEAMIMVFNELIWMTVKVQI